jgi:transposase
MPHNRAVPVMLSAGERRRLKKRARGAKTAHRDRLRAQIVLAAARGRASARIAADLPVSVDTVRKWRGRFAARGLEGLADLPRSGRPRRISALERAAVVALACQLPAATGVPLARWSGPELAAELMKAGLASPISPSSVLRILAEHPVKPWRYQSWIYPRPGLRRQGHRHPGPLPGLLPRPAATAGRPGHLKARASAATRRNTSPGNVSYRGCSTASSAAISGKDRVLQLAPRPAAEGVPGTAPAPLKERYRVDAARGAPEQYPGRLGGFSWLRPLPSWHT